MKKKFWIQNKWGVGGTNNSTQQKHICYRNTSIDKVLLQPYDLQDLK